MSSKKKKTTINKVAPVEAEQLIDPEPVEEVPTIQIEEVHDTESESVEQPVEPVAEVEPQPIVEVVAEPAPTVEPIVEVKPQPVVEPAPAPVKPKPLTMTSLHAEIVELRKIIDGQAILIKQLMETPIKQRKPPTSTGKVQIRDMKTNVLYPSKNNVYQTLLKSGELDDLVKQGVFGSDPSHNSFGCYNLFRAYHGRFVEVKPEETKV
jgi:hypothetical protein